MTPHFVLELAPSGIGLYHRRVAGEGGTVWVPLGVVPLDAPDLTDQIAFLRRTALELDGAGFATRLLLPNDVVHYTRLTADAAPADDPARITAAARRQVMQETGLAEDEFVIDWLADEDGIAVAAVETVTLEEAESFAVGHRLHPVCFVAAPPEGTFPGEAFFGRTRFAEAFIGKEAPLGREPRPFAPAAPEGAETDGAPTANGDAAEEAKASDDRGALPSPDAALPPETTGKSADPLPDDGPIPFRPRPRPRPPTSPPAPASADPVPPGRLDPKDIRIARPASPDEVILDGFVTRLGRPHPPFSWRRVLPGAMVTLLVLALGGVWWMIRPVPPPEPATAPGIAEAPALAPRGGGTDGHGTEPPSPKTERPAPTTRPGTPPLPQVPEAASGSSPGPARLPPAAPSATPGGTTRTALPAPAAEGGTAAPDAAGNAAPPMPPRPASPSPDRKGAEEEEGRVVVAAIRPSRPLPGPLRGSPAAPVIEGDHLETGPRPAEAPPAAPLPPESRGEDELFLPEEAPPPEGSDAVSPAAFGAHEIETTPEADRPWPRGSGPAGEAGRETVPTPEGTLTADGIRLFAGRPEPAPPPRPEEATPAPLAAATTVLRPPPRPETALRETTALEAATAFAGLPRPPTRPFALPRPGRGPKIVAAPQRDVPAGPEIVRLPGTGTPQYARRPHAPASTTVARAATERGGLTTNGLTLIGIFGTGATPRALVRLASGRVMRVKVGDRLSGGKVIAIGEGRLVLLKGTRRITLKMPRG